MDFLHMFFDLDFRNNLVNTQKDAVDTFFQAHTIEFWDVSSNEVLFGTYDDGVTAGATNFTIFDAGEDGIKGNLVTLNASTNLATFVAANQIIKMMVVEDRIILLQYLVR